MDKKGKAVVLWVVLGAVVLIGLLLIGWYISTYNSLVSLDTSVQAKWADVKVQYQRRADLIPNLVATVQGAANFETETQTQIAQLRTQAVAAQQAMQNAQTPEEGVAAAQQVDAAATRFAGLNINVENYPELRATANFASLQDELAGTENRVAVARRDYNEIVRQYNVKVRTFPSNLIAGMSGFEQHTLFESSPGSENAPTVSFT